MYPRVPSRPKPWHKGKDERLPVDKKGNKIPYEGRGTEDELLLQIEVVKGLTSERRERIRFLASILNRRSITRPFDEGLIARLGRQFGLQRLQIKIILETVEDDMANDAHLREIIGLDATGRRAIHADLQFASQAPGIS